MLVSDGRHQGDLTSHLFHLARLQRRLVDHFDGNGLIGQSLYCQGNLTESTLANNSLDTIASQSAWEMCHALLLWHIVSSNSYDQWLIFILTFIFLFLLCLFLLIIWINFNDPLPWQYLIFSGCAATSPTLRCRLTTSSRMTISIFRILWAEVLLSCCRVMLRLYWIGIRCLLRALLLFKLSLRVSRPQLLL